MKKTTAYAKGKFHSSVRRRPRAKAKQNNIRPFEPLEFTWEDGQFAKAVKAYFEKTTGFFFGWVQLPHVRSRGMKRAKSGRSRK